MNERERERYMKPQRKMPAISLPVVVYNKYIHINIEIEEWQQHTLHTKLILMGVFLVTRGPLISYMVSQDSAEQQLVFYSD